MILDKATQNKLREIHNPDGSKLREMQLKMKEILDVVHMVCEKNNIPYWLSSGTLLGAVRHGGFIPWDDDVDIDMLWSDIPRFIKACARDLPEGYVLQTHKSDPNYYAVHLKVRDLKTQMKEQGADQYTYKGYFIDIIPIECSFLPLCKLSKYFIILHKIADNYNSPRWLLEVLYRFRQIVFYLFRLLSFFKINKDECYPSYGTLFYNKRLLSNIFPLKTIVFENSLYYSPNNCHSYLRDMFGDYASLPETKFRKPGHNSSLL